MENIATVPNMTLQLTSNTSITVRVYIRRTHYPINDVNQALKVGNSMCLLSFSTESCPFELIVVLGSAKRVRKEVECHISLCDHKDEIVQDGLKRVEGEIMDSISFSGLKRKLSSKKFGINKSSFHPTPTNPPTIPNEQIVMPSHFKVVIRGKGNADCIEFRTPCFFVYSKIPGNVCSKDYVLRYLRSNAELIRYGSEDSNDLTDHDRHRSTVHFYLSKVYSRVSFYSLSKVILGRKFEDIQKDIFSDLGDIPTQLSFEKWRSHDMIILGSSDASPEITEDQRPMTKVSGNICTLPADRIDDASKEKKREIDLGGNLDIDAWAGRRNDLIPTHAPANVCHHGISKQKLEPWILPRFTDLNEYIKNHHLDVVLLPPLRLEQSSWEWNSDTEELDTHEIPQPQLSPGDNYNPQYRTQEVPGEEMANFLWEEVLSPLNKRKVAGESLPMPPETESDAGSHPSNGMCYTCSPDLLKKTRKIAKCSRQ